MILGPRFCGREDIWKGWRTIALYLRFSKQGACGVYYQNIVDFLFRVVKVCLCIYLILWKLSESFREIVNFLLCLFDAFLLGILALWSRKLSFILFCFLFVRCYKELGDISWGLEESTLGVGGLHGWGENLWLWDPTLSGAVLHDFTMIGLFDMRRLITCIVITCILMKIHCCIHCVFVFCDVKSK